MQADLGRADRYVEHRGDLRVREAFDLLEHEHGAKVGWERMERLLDRECGVGWAPAGVKAPFVQLHERPRTPLAEPHERDARGDGAEPEGSVALALGRGYANDYTMACGPQTLHPCWTIGACRRLSAARKERRSAHFRCGMPWPRG